MIDRLQIVCLEHGQYGSLWLVCREGWPEGIMPVAIENDSRLEVADLESIKPRLAGPGTLAASAATAVVGEMNAVPKNVLPLLFALERTRFRRLSASPSVFMVFSYRRLRPAGIDTSGAIIPKTSNTSRKAKVKLSGWHSFIEPGGNAAATSL